MKARVLLYDIETAPILGTAWGKWEQNLVWIVKDWYMLTFAYKWLGDKKTHVLGLPDFKTYAKDPENDIELVKALRELFDEADVVIAHNGNSFDQKKSQARMVLNGLTPPSPYQQIDTKLVAKRYFSFTSNSLNDLGRELKCGQKLDTGGYDLWRSCLAGDPKAWKKMKKYNKQDVVLLEEVYLKLLPWINSHPPMNSILHRPSVCPKCGGPKMVAGMKYTASKSGIRYQYFRCNSCGGVAKSRIPEPLAKDERNMYV